MKKIRTTLPDWSNMIPLLPAEGSRRAVLYSALRALIETGQLRPGAKLPPSRQLATQLTISRGSVVAALDQLVADGFAETRIGSGTFVAQAVPLLRGGAAKPDFKLELLPIRPGRMGSAMMDEWAFTVFRRLIARDLRRPPLNSLHYSDPRGSSELREEIAGYLRSARGVRLHADQIMITSGSRQALDYVLRSLFSPGDSIWVEDPGYPAVLDLIQSNRLTLVPVPVDEEGIDAKIGVSLAPRAKGVYVTPSHQYPLGVTMSMRRRLALIAWAKSTSSWIIEDDYDSEFRYAGPPLTSLQGMDGAGRVIYLGTFSKALYPGLRVGYVVLPEAIMARVIALRERTDHYPQTLAEGALAAFLREGYFSAHLRRAKKRANASRDALMAGLNEGPIKAVKPAQGLHLVAQFPARLSENRALALATKAGLYARPLSRMYLAAKPVPGLLIGFSAFAPADFRRAAGALSRLAQQELRHR